MRSAKPKTGGHEPLTLSHRTAGDLFTPGLFQHSAAGLGTIALSTLLRADPRGTHFAAKAKRVIFLFMAGGPSHVDLFDPKPRLQELDGKPIPAELLKDHQQFALIRGTPALKGSSRLFAPCGRSGTIVSDWLPHLAEVVDDIAVIRSMKTDTNVHDPAVNLMNCGSMMFDRPTLGAWLSYELGSDNHNLPAYMVLTSGFDDGQPLLQSFWGNGFLNSRHQGVPFRNQGDAVLHLANPATVTREQRREQLDLLRWMNQRQHDALGDPEILSRIASYEMAFRMQASIPALTDLRNESPATLRLYGAEPGKPSFANNCLMARRLVEAGVRFFQLYDRGWDSHTDIQREHTRQCTATDRPTAALLTDLKQRGLLDDTLVIWGGEFGRTPVAQVSGKTFGRDHLRHHRRVRLPHRGEPGARSRSPRNHPAPLGHRSRTARLPKPRPGLPPHRCLRNRGEGSAGLNPGPE